MLELLNPPLEWRDIIAGNGPGPSGYCFACGIPSVNFWPQLNPLKKFRISSPSSVLLLSQSIVLKLSFINLTFTSSFWRTPSPFVSLAFAFGGNSLFFANVVWGIRKILMIAKIKVKYNCLFLLVIKISFSHFIFL